MKGLIVVTLGDKIRIAREQAGLTLEELGKQCVTTKQTIYKYENNIITNIPIDRIELIAAVVGVSSASLLGWEKKEQSTETDGLSPIKKEFIGFVETLSEEQAARALRVLRTIVEELP